MFNGLRPRRQGAVFMVAQFVIGGVTGVLWSLPVWADLTLGTVWVVVPVIFLRRRFGRWVWRAAPHTPREGARP